jgi:hypothetical protein
MDYTVSLALVDFLPVIFSGIGVLVLAWMIGRFDSTSGKVAYLSAALIVLGGLSKAGWKLIIAATGTDILLLENLLFIFLGPGFTLLSWSLWNAQQVMQDKEIAKNVWLRPLGVIVLFGTGAVSARVFQPDERYWFFILLTLTTFANMAVSVLVIRQSSWQGQKLAAALFIVNLVGVFALNGMARVEQNIAMQWVEEILQVLTQLAFAVAAWLMTRKAGKQGAVYSKQFVTE